jgi:hypothetical protein
MRVGVHDRYRYFEKGCNGDGSGFTLVADTVVRTYVSLRGS